MKLDEKLKILREEKGYSQERLAEKIGVSRQAVSKWELGLSYPDIENLMALRDLYRISIDRLVRDNEEEHCSYQEIMVKSSFDEGIIEFLCRAKKATYAAGGAEVESSRPNSHDFEYVEGNYKYIDTYLGGERFAGEEALFCEDIPCWSMNYIGRIINEGFSGDFLKECLLLVSKERPYRGPQVYQNGEYIYHNIINGNFEWFSGYEEIFFNKIKVYECIFHGGCLSG